MSVSRATIRAKLASSMTTMLAEGVTIDDFIEAVRTAAKQRALQAQAEPMPAFREEAALFYADVDQILANVCYRLEVAARSAKSIARRR
jgi:hypothetical protein